MKKNYSHRQSYFANSYLKFPFYLVVITMVWIAGCAPPSVKTTVLIPAASDNAARLKQIAVLPFDGRQGQEFAIELEGLLASIAIDDKQYFTLVDRVRLNEVLSELKLAQSGFVQESTVAQIGQMVGAKGIYTGVVTESNATDSPYRENRSRCVHYVTKKDNKGREYQVCDRYKNYQVQCVKRTARFCFTPKLTDVETGKIVYSRNIAGTANASGCADGQAPVAGAPELINLAKRQALGMFRYDVAPHYTTMTIKMMNDTDGIDSPEAREKFKSGLEFAEKERFDRACALWDEVMVSSPKAIGVLYNLGVCAEMVGHLDQALDFYQQADKLTSKPDDRITEALIRSTDLIKKQKKLESQN
ncbi:MAG: hypothetical protein JXA41_04300 [Deltaproteobacteria bacterium]|nr:hypothetical protein [Deltaproteobacteria bacterium]